MARKRQRGVPKRRTGRPIKHGAYALVFRDEIIKQHPELVRYCRDCYDDLIHDLAPAGPETLSAAKRILLGRLLSKLQVGGLLDIYLGTHGLLRRDKLDARIVECEPAVQTWLQVNNAIRADLQLLGLERQKLEPRVLTAEELVDAVEAERALARTEETKETAPGAEGTDPNIDGGNDGQK